jgi:transcriptional regulator with PAS, ATPase and Fis domain
MDVCDRILVGNSPAIQGVKELVRHIAKSNLNVIICGESGVGKELVAQALHLSSDRRNHPFIKVNCAAIPNELLESELFGYERGAFTGADKTKMGRFELADKGTVLLDEIGDMPLLLQSKMLQVLQDFQFSRLGAKKDVTVDCWVLAASNQDLEHAVSSGRFREDLYYRLNIISIFIPPLRERAEDIEPLIDYFAGQVAHKIQPMGFEFTDSIRDFLREYSWPGNVRELKNTVERLILLEDWETMHGILMHREAQRFNHRGLADQSAPHIPDKADEKKGLKKAFPPLKEVKRKAILKAEGDLIREVLQETGWNRKLTADILQISYKALLYKIKKLNLRPPE